MSIGKAVGSVVRALKHPIERMPGWLTGWYDENIMRGLFFQWYDDTAAEIVSDMKEGDILDVCTGAGYIPIFLSIKAPAVRIRGVDLAAGMIRRAGIHAREFNAGNNLRFDVADAAHLPFHDRSFDMVINTMAVHCFRKPVIPLDEMYRVLKDNGKVWLYDIHPYRADDPGDRAMLQKIRTLTPWFIRPFITEKSMSGSYSREEIEGFFRESKFKVSCFSENGIFYKFEAVKQGA